MLLCNNSINSTFSISALIALLPDAIMKVFINGKTLIFKKLFQANSNLTIQKWENWPISSVFSKHAPQISTLSHDEGPNIQLVSFHEQLENWSKHRKQLFSDITWCVAQGCDLWEKKNIKMSHMITLDFCSPRSRLQFRRVNPSRL